MAYLLVRGALTTVLPDFAPSNHDELSSLIASSCDTPALFTEPNDA
jgi:hypothetical protein